MNDHLKAHRDFQQVMDDSMSKLRETFQTWLQQRQEQVVNLDTYTPEPSQYQKIPICYDDDDDEYSFATQEYLKKFSSSSVEDLVHTPSESDGVSEGECDLPVCDESSLKIDLLIEEFAGELALIALIPPGIVEANLDPKEDIYVPFRDNSLPLDISKDQFEGFSDSNDDSTSIDDDSFSIDDIDYVEASPPDSELVSLEEVKDFHTEDGEIEDDILREKLSKINLLIAKIEAINSNPPPSSDFVTNSGSTTTRSDYSLPDYEAFYLDDDHIKEKSSGSTTTHADFSQYDSFIFDLSINPFPPADRSDFYHEEFAGELTHIISLSEYEHFYFKIKPELGNFTMDVVEDIFDNSTREPRVHVPNVLPTHYTLHLDSDFTFSSDSLGSDLAFSFPSGTRNKIFDPGIFIGVQSMRFLSLDEFSISFIRDLPFPVIGTFLPFSPQNEDKVFNPGILASNEETSPHLLSYRGFNPSKIIFDFSESPMMIYGGDIPILDVPFLHFYPP
ncbi:hypothetical protein Tco_1547699 [Tanacetum coccineum]